MRLHPSQLPPYTLKLLRLVLKLLKSSGVQGLQPLALSGHILLKGTALLGRLVGPLLGLDVALLRSPQSIGRPGGRLSTLPLALRAPCSSLSGPDGALIGSLPAEILDDGAFGADPIFEGLDGRVRVGARCGLGVSPDGGSSSATRRITRRITTRSRLIALRGRRRRLSRHGGRALRPLAPLSPASRWHGNEPVRVCHTFRTAAETAILAERGSTRIGGAAQEGALSICPDWSRLVPAESGAPWSVARGGCMRPRRGEPAMHGRPGRPALEARGAVAEVGGEPARRDGALPVVSPRGSGSNWPPRPNGCVSASQGHLIGVALDALENGRGDGGSELLDIQVCLPAVAGRHLRRVVLLQEVARSGNPGKGARSTAQPTLAAMPGWLAAAQRGAKRKATEGD